ncbi:hypothetical protein [Clostridium estertheticum]|uniref:hypothetical protein n=1 Tax=Clostridium estertheticum TaxID=238834 RepID=UPI001C0B8BEE|nr:hypothetical protein [Clostridium estertheticum]MBU3173257.1 hypothetical protein [Clostridium estertheticum]
MENKLEKLKFNALISFIGMVIFLGIGTFVSEVGKRIGRFNIITFIGCLGLFLGVMFIIGFAYNIVNFFTVSAYEQNNKK